VVRGKRKKCVAGAGLSSVGRAAFLHNVIIVSPSYNATLCKEALGKVFVALHHLSIGVINFWHTKTF